MQPRTGPTPAQLARLALLGTLIASAPFVLPWPHSRSERLSWTFLLPCLALLALGFFLALKSASALKNGVQNQRWPEEQIEPLRAHLESPFYGVLAFVLLAAFALFEGIFTHFKGLGWVCYLFLQALSQLRIALKRPRVSVPPVNWHTFAPIRSEHWGER